MPRKRRRVKAKHSAFRELDSLRLTELLCGPFSATDPELIRGLWERHRETLLRYFTSDPDRWEGRPEAIRPRGPGRRPWSWWQWDAPEPRRLLAGEPYPEADPELYFGLPAYSIRGCMGRVYESQPAYLVRLGLLLEGEDPGDYPPAVDWLGQPAGLHLVKGLRNDDNTR